ncbi:hypothetical protein EGM51_11695 [Verrucomicrobia bacterium S94]|nr:hypothetical protein EGM51_11695 [Verrucomicrobia bacterium S94]
MKASRTMHVPGISILLVFASTFVSYAAVLSNGGNHTGSITTNDVNDTWTFSADTGDSIILRIGEVTTAYGTFSPWIRLYSPGGVLIEGDSSASDAEIAHSITNTGVYTVVVESYVSGGAGTYNLRYANAGKPFVIPVGDEGGELTNGENHFGMIGLADVDMWTFSADAGDLIILRIGEVSTDLGTFSPWILLYGPDGSFIEQDANSSDALISYSATTGGVYTVVVENYISGGAGTYNLRYANAGKPFVIPVGDEGGELTNGENHFGVIGLADVDMWTFSADAGDLIILRIGEVSTDLGTFSPWILLYGPDGSFIEQDANSSDALISYSATTGGVYTVVVENYISGGAGTYNLRYANVGKSFVVPAGDEGGALTNGANHIGITDLADIDMWTFSADEGDTLRLRIGEVTTELVSFSPWILLYGPDGSLISQDTNSSDAEIVHAATTGGVYRVVVENYISGGAGTYNLRYANTGKSFVVPAGDEGGALTNGANHIGITDLADVDLWTFSADAGDSIILRCGDVSTEPAVFSPWILLYGPDGSSITHSANASDALISHSITSGGVYTVVVENYISGGVGTYNLRFANIGNLFIVPSGDEGGALAAEIFPEGEVDLGDLDLFEFSACAGDPIQLDCIELVDAGGMTLQLNLYDPDGVLIDSDAGSSEAAIPLLAAPEAGTYTILVFSYSAGGSGTYRLEHNGLQDGIRLCSAEVIGLDETVFGVGAEPGSTNVLWATTNLVTGIWEPAATNLADSAGFVLLSSELKTAEEQRYFKIGQH